MKGNSRIRYRQLGNTPILRSVRKFKDSSYGGIYEVDLDTEKMIYKIRNVNTRCLVRSTEKDGKNPPKHLHTLKRHAKKALLSLRVDFDIEVRNVYEKDE